jgi:glycosyltransferase involved in cell wall biosynthesis
MLDWCDVAWFEWCTQQAVDVSRRPHDCKTIVRLHRYEAYRDWPGQVRWENIDALVTVGNRAVTERLKDQVPGLAERTQVIPIPNGVDLNRFAFRDRTQGKNLAVVAHVNYWKNPMFLLQCFAKLRSIDPDYRLYWAGPFQDDGVLKQYLDCMVDELALADAVRFEGFQADIPGWLEDKHYLLSGSLVEGHPVNVLEGMACGLKPVIHTFPGSREFFPPHLLFRTPEEFCKRIVDEPYQPNTYREFVAERYSATAQHDRIKQLVLELSPDDTPSSQPAEAL